MALIIIIITRYFTVHTFGFGTRNVLNWYLHSLRTSVPVPQEVSIDVMDVGVDSWTTRDTARGHVGVILRVDILKALPWHTWAEL